MPNIPGGANDEKVTMALLVHRIEELSVRLEKIEDKIDKYNKCNDGRYNSLCLDIERLKGREVVNKDDLILLRHKLESWNILNSIAAAIAVILSIALAELLK